MEGDVSDSFDLARIRCIQQRPQAEGIQFRRLDGRLCVHAVGWNGKRSPRRLFSLSRDQGAGERRSKREKGTRERKRLMQAIQLTKYGEPEESLRLVEIAEPDRPKPGQILIRVEYAPINDNDMLLARGLYTIQPKLPSVVGNEGAGKVLAVGDGVHNVKIGDRVVIPLGVFSWAEKVLAPAEKAIVLPAEIDPRQAAMLSINPPAAALLLEEFVSLKPGDWIVQNASNSGVGRSVIAFAKQKGVRTINIVRRPQLIQELKDIGADVVLLAGPNAAAEANRATGGALVRLALDGVGSDA